MSVIDNLKQMISEIVSKFPAVRVLYLFGSHASGDSKPDSDVDIAVFTDGNESPTMDLEMEVFLQQRINRSVDVVTMQKVSPIVQHEVLRNKILLFEKDPDERAFLETKSFRFFLDARHYQKKRSAWRKAKSGKCSYPKAVE